MVSMLLELPSIYGFKSIGSCLRLLELSTVYIGGSPRSRSVACGLTHHGSTAALR